MTMHVGTNHFCEYVDFILGYVSSSKKFKIRNQARKVITIIDELQFETEELVWLRY